MDSFLPSLEIKVYVLPYKILSSEYDFSADTTLVVQEFRKITDSDRLRNNFFIIIELYI